VLKTETFSPTFVPPFLTGFGFGWLCFLTQQTFHSTKLNHIAMQNMLWRLNTPALILVSVSIVKWKKEEFMYLCSDLFFSLPYSNKQIGFSVLSVGDILLCVFVKMAREMCSEMCKNKANDNDDE
jgi:hypothetical protein